MTAKNACRLKPTCHPSTAKIGDRYFQPLLVGKYLPGVLFANEDFDSNSVTCGVQAPSNLSLNMVELCLIGALADPHCPCKDFSRAGRIRSTNGCRPISQGAPRRAGLSR